MVMKKDNKDIPAVLYRYMSVQGIIPTLKNHALRLADPETFNDEHEFTYQHIKLSKVAIERKYHDATFRENVRDSLWWNTHTKKKERIEYMWKIANQGKDNLREDLQKYFRICCFTKSNTNPYMWKSYAGDYSGAVLEFRFADKRNIQPVKYSNALPPYSWGLPYDNGIHFKKIMLHKMVEPFYREQEYRQILPADYVQRAPKLCNSYNQPQIEAFIDKDNKLNETFAHSELSAVFLGKNIAEKDKEEILSLLAHNSYRHVLVMQMNAAEEEITFEPIVHT